MRIDRPASDSVTQPGALRLKPAAVATGPALPQTAVSQAVKLAALRQRPAEDERLITARDVPADADASQDVIVPEAQSQAMDILMGVEPLPSADAGGDILLAQAGGGAGGAGGAAGGGAAGGGLGIGLAIGGGVVLVAAAGGGGGGGGGATAPASGLPPANVSAVQRIGFVAEDAALREGPRGDRFEVTGSTGNDAATALAAGKFVLAAGASLQGTYGTFTFDSASGLWTYTLDDSDPDTQALRDSRNPAGWDRLELASTDGKESVWLEVGIYGYSDLPNAPSTPQTVVQGDWVLIDLSRPEFDLYKMGVGDNSYIYLYSGSYTYWFDPLGYSGPDWDDYGYNEVSDGARFMLLYTGPLDVGPNNIWYDGKGYSSGYDGVLQYNVVEATGPGNAAPSIALDLMLDPDYGYAYTSEGQSYDLGLVLTDEDAHSGLYTLIAWVSNYDGAEEGMGWFLANGGSGVTVLGSGTEAVALQGTLAALNSYLAGGGLDFYVDQADGYDWWYLSFALLDHDPRDPAVGFLSGGPGGGNPGSYFWEPGGFWLAVDSDPDSGYNGAASGSTHTNDAPMIFTAGSVASWDQAKAAAAIFGEGTLNLAHIALGATRYVAGDNAAGMEEPDDMESQRLYFSSVFGGEGGGALPLGVYDEEAASGDGDWLTLTLSAGGGGTLTLPGGQHMQYYDLQIWDPTYDGEDGAWVWLTEADTSLFTEVTTLILRGNQYSLNELGNQKYLPTEWVEADGDGYWSNYQWFDPLYWQAPATFNVGDSSVVTVTLSDGNSTTETSFTVMGAEYNINPTISFSLANGGLSDAMIDGSTFYGTLTEDAVWLLSGLSFSDANGQAGDKYMFQFYSWSYWNDWNQQSMLSLDPSYHNLLSPHYFDSFGEVAWHNQSLSLYGTLDEVNAMLAAGGLRYHLPADLNSENSTSPQLQVYIQDFGQNGAGWGGQSATFNLSVDPVNDAPKVIQGAHYSVNYPMEGAVWFSDHNFLYASTGTEGLEEAGGSSLVSELAIFDAEWWGESEGGMLTVSNVTRTSGTGTLAYDADEGAWNYTPGMGETQATFSYQVSDGEYSVTNTLTLHLLIG